MSKSLTQYRLVEQFRQRLYFFSGVIFIITLIMVIQLVNLQLVYGAENRILSKKFVSRQEYTTAPRGLIYDRNYETAGVDSLLVKNINYIDFIIYPARFANHKDGLTYVKQFCLLMGRSFDDYNEIWSARFWKRLVVGNKPYTLLERLTRKEQERLASFYEISSQGKFITRHLRFYTQGRAMAHVTGYIGLPNRRDILTNKALSYQMLGKDGIETFYDHELRGSDGVRIRHKIFDSEEQLSPSEHGNNLVLTIDQKIQTAAFHALEESNKKGAVVAMKATTGEILAMVSNPAFDPNILSSGSSEQRSKHMNSLKNRKAFLNLAIQARFSPASTFKPVVSLAALENSAETNVSVDTTHTCRGSWTLKSSLASVPDSKYYCWHRNGHGSVNMTEALAHSCNIYFYQLGYHIGPSKIIQFARSFGLGEKTGIDLPGEINGFIPTQQWKRLRRSSRWFDGDTVNLAIGQGFLQTTPLSIAMFYSALVNGGKLYRPHLLKEIRDSSSNRVLVSIRPELIREVPFSEANREIILKGLRAVVTDGTARGLMKYKLPIAGKTGTVQTASKRQGIDHAWFVGYAPFDADPDDAVVVAVFLEFGIGGAASAAPIAAKTLEAALPTWNLEMTGSDNRKVAVSTD